MEDRQRNLRIRHLIRQPRKLLWLVRDNFPIVPRKALQLNTFRFSPDRGRADDVLNLEFPKPNAVSLFLDDAGILPRSESGVSLGYGAGDDQFTVCENERRGLGRTPTDRDSIEAFWAVLGVGDLSSDLDQV